MQRQTFENKNVLQERQTNALLHKHGNDIVMYLERIENFLGENEEVTVDQDEMSLKVQSSLPINYKALQYNLELFEEQVKDNRSNKATKLLEEMFVNIMDWVKVRLIKQYSPVDYYCLMFANVLLIKSNTELQNNHIYRQLIKKVGNNNARIDDAEDTPIKSKNDRPGNNLLAKYYNAKQNTVNNIEQASNFEVKNTNVNWNRGDEAEDLS